MIEVTGLTKYYGRQAAISDLSFNIRRGEVVGFLGLNGAGKSTTLRILGGVLLPTSGRVRIDGLDAEKSRLEVSRKIGFLPDTPPLYDEMTVGDYLAFVARLRGVPAERVEGQVRRAEEKTALTEAHRTSVGSLSHGFRQRVGVAQALVHDPALLVLDEPTSGLDPVQIVEMRSLIRSLKGEHTVLVSSHILPEISQICDHLLVIQAGAIVAQGTEEELASRLGEAAAIEVEVGGAQQRAEEVIKSLPEVRRVELLSAADGRVALRVEAPLALRPRLARALVQADLELIRLDRSAHQLESIFLKLTQGKEAA